MMSAEAQTFAVTIFQDKAAATLDVYRWSADELAERIRGAATYSDKEKCPLIKLALFGDQRTEKNSLRSDGNVTNISGETSSPTGAPFGIANALRAASRAGRIGR